MNKGIGKNHLKHIRSIIDSVCEESKILVDNEYVISVKDFYRVNCKIKSKFEKCEKDINEYLENLDIKEKSKENIKKYALAYYYQKKSEIETYSFDREYKTISKFLKK